MMSENNRATTNLATTNSRRIWRWLGGTGLFAVVATFLALFVGHLQLVSSCNQLLDLYTNQANQLQQLVEQNEDIAKITADEVLNDDRAIVNDFQSSYKRAKELLQNELSDHQCVATSPADVLRRAINDLSEASGQMQQVIRAIDIGGERVKQANHDKKLSDAQSALRSTILSANNLINNPAINQSIRTQLNRAVATAGSVLESGDLDNTVSVRRQLDNIIDQINESLSNIAAELADIEAKVRAVTNVVDDNGSYTTAAVNILHTAGLQEVWGLEQMRGACSISNNQANSWIAAFCSATPDKVYINNRLDKDITDDSYFADAMRHEIAHYLIYRRCGTSEPSSIGVNANAESTASSYAVLYLGANANTLNRAGDIRYHMNRASDEAAARIHAGQCTAR